MTLTNGASPSDDYERNMSPKLEALLQTNNELVFTIHKAFLDSSAEMNRKIVGSLIRLNAML